ncbi:hypothetical protein P7C71_g2036, partial [Lecanoromycetidae sp. Uapishka_2]
MASRILAPSMRAFQQSAATSPLRNSRTFRSSARLLDSAVAGAPARRPVGAFRGGLFGFLLGSTLAGAGTYYYILEEYKVSNELLTEDIYVSRDPIDQLLEFERRLIYLTCFQALQAAVQRIHSYVSKLEERLDAAEKKKK